MCSRCNTRWQVSLPTDAVSVDVQPAAGTCGRCSQQWDLEMQPLLVHAHNAAVAHLRPQACRLLDLLPSLYAAQCGSCATIASFRYYPPVECKPVFSFDSCCSGVLQSDLRAPSSWCVPVGSLPVRSFCHRGFLRVGSLSPQWGGCTCGILQHGETPGSRCVLVLLPSL